MVHTYSHLFSPIKVGNLTLKNRLISSPISLFDLERTPEHRRSFNDLGFYKQRAQGGAAIITIGDSIVHRTGNADGFNTPKNMICSVDSIPFLVDVTDEIHRYGAYANIELNHGGIRAAWPGIDSWGVENCIAPSGGKVIGMNEEMIAEIVEAFGSSAENAKKAGFDMVMIHAGHSWLLGQFLSPATNHRTDRFGGSLENRARILFMVIDSVRKHCGNKFPIEIRMSAAECMPEGINGIELNEGIELAKMLDGKVDLIHVSAGSTLYPSSEVITHPSQFVEHGINVKYAKAIKTYVKTPVVTVGTISDPTMMDKIIASGAADIIAVGRGLIADPDMPEKARHGHAEDIRPCLRCFHCIGHGGWNGELRCSVNPTIGRPWEFLLPRKETTPKTLLIAGGGPGGMEAALTAYNQGHKVVLCEKENVLGGTIRYSEGIDFKIDLWNYLNYLIDQIKKTDIDVRLNTKVTKELVQQISPNCLIVAIGAKPIIPPIQGVEKATSLLDAHLRKVPIGDRVIIIGGGLAGIEAAINYARQGKTPIVLEMGDKYAPESNTMHRWAIEVEIEKYNIDIRLNTKCVAIENNSVDCENISGECITLQGDTILYAVGSCAREKEVEELRDSCEEFQWIGDCRKPGQIIGAVRGGFDAALNI